jgi:hypothetical protein
MNAYLPLIGINQTHVLVVDFNYLCDIIESNIMG